MSRSLILPASRSSHITAVSGPFQYLKSKAIDSYDQPSRTLALQFFSTMLIPITSTASSRRIHTAVYSHRDATGAIVPPHSSLSRPVFVARGFLTPGSCMSLGTLRNLLSARVMISQAAAPARPRSWRSIRAITYTPYSDAARVLQSPGFAPAPRSSWFRGQASR